MAATGYYHSICLDDDGCLWSFGYNNKGQLGLGDNTNRQEPHKIEGLPRILSVSCGYSFSACVDSDGVVWCFGENGSGQLGLGHTTAQNKPTKVPGLPPIRSVHCGAYHTLCIDHNSELWAFGQNSNGQLGLGNSTQQNSPQKVPVTNISLACCGGEFSTIQDNNGHVYSCGHNEYGQLGLGHKEQQNRFVRLSSLPDISSFSCGWYHQVFLTATGDALAVGYNGHGELGTGDNTSRSSAVKISALSNITHLSCGRNHTMAISDKGQLYTFGNNGNGELGTGDKQNRNSPQALPLQHACSLSHGVSNSTIVGDKNGKVWAFGYNDYGQLGIGSTQQQLTPVALNDKYNGIISSNSRAAGWKGAQKSLEWSDQDIRSLDDIGACLQALKNDLVALNNDKERLVSSPSTGTAFRSWKEAKEFLESKLSLAALFLTQFTQTQAGNNETIQQLTQEIRQLEEQLAQKRQELESTKKRQQHLQDELPAVENAHKHLQLYKQSADKLSAHESDLTEKFFSLIEEKSLELFTEADVCLTLWRMGLMQYKQAFCTNHVTGEVLESLTVPMCKHLGMSKRDACMLMYHVRMMKTTKYLQEAKSESSECVICMHNTTEQTLHLLEEYEVPLPAELIMEQQWTAPSLIYCDNYKETFNIESFQDWMTTKLKMEEWKAIHEHHLQALA
mmetsp:Transcript_6097/g.7518  ORF Transcript_6097/g.7518 Transcript_6097/m.7518 type:complete len:676 (-) Transcript_6097:28-2055(-)